MIVPQEAPKGVEVTETPTGLRLTLRFGWFGIGRDLSHHAAIWLYQTLAKFSRKSVMSADVNELLLDLIGATQAAVQQHEQRLVPTKDDPYEEVPLNYFDLEAISDLMVKKGWVKT